MFENSEHQIFKHIEAGNLEDVKKYIREGRPADLLHKISKEELWEMGIGDYCYINCGFLLAALVTDQIEIFKFLLKKDDIDPYAREDSFLTLAAQFGAVNCLKYLLSAEVVGDRHRDVNYYLSDKRYTGSSALDHAAKAGQLSIVKYLTSAQVTDRFDIDPVVRERYSTNLILFHVACRGHWDVVQYMLSDKMTKKYPGIIENPTQGLRSAITDSIWNGHVDTACFLLETLKGLAPDRYEYTLQRMEANLQGENKANFLKVKNELKRREMAPEVNRLIFTAHYKNPESGFYALPIELVDVIIHKATPGNPIPAPKRETSTGLQHLQ